MRPNQLRDRALLATYNGTHTYFALEDWAGTKRAEASAGGCYSTFTSMSYGDERNQAIDRAAKGSDKAAGGP